MTAASELGAELWAQLFSISITTLMSSHRRSLVFFTSLFDVCYIHGLATLPKDSNFVYSCIILISLIAGHKYTQTRERLKLDKPAVHCKYVLVAVG